jgi:hypothetical protein
MKTCNKCGKSIKEDFDFCPYCGNSLDDNNNWGMLGRTDHSIERDLLGKDIFGGGIFKMFGSAMKLLEKELQKEMKNTDKIQSAPKTKLQLYINGKKINIEGTPKKRIIKRPKKEIKNIPSTYFSKESLKRFSNLPRESPKTNVRRLSDRIIYEIEMPGVKSIKDVSIIRLESSIEIKAIGKNKSYFKVIQVGLPIIDYYLSKGKLILELVQRINS